MLSRPSSLQGPSDIPPPIARLLPVSSDLKRACPPPKYGGGGGTSGPRLRLLSPHAAGLTPGSRQVLAPSCFPAGTGLPQNRSGSACIPKLSGLSRSRTLSAITVRAYLTRLHHSLYATACGFGWHPGLSTTPARSGGRLRGTMSGQVQPPCYQNDPPPAYTPKKGNWCGNLLPDC